MKKHQIKQAFTLVELVVVIVILAILGTIAFIALSGYSTQARDSARISDLSSIKTGLELFNLESGKYPLPTDYALITYSGGIEVWKQGTFGETMNVNVDKLDKIPVDPLVAKQYTYSLTSKGNEYQLGGIMEGTEITINTPLNKGGIIQSTNAGEVDANAYVTGNYNGLLTKVNNGIACDILSVPSIITNNIDVTDLDDIVANNLFVYRGYKNLPSSYRGSKFNEYGGFPFTPNKLVAYSDTGNCETLTDRTDNTSKIKLIKGLQYSYIGTILQNQGDIKNIVEKEININNPSQDVLNTAINTVNNSLGGNIVLERESDPELPGCTTQPAYTNAIFTAGTATQLSQQWQSTDSNAACYWTCGVGKVLQGIDCLSSTASGTAPNGTSEISNATSLIGGTWNYNTIPGVATYTCNIGYTRGGGVCNINTYTVSGSIGASAGGATLNIGGTSVTADGSGNFSSTINYGTSISNITITKTGYTCSVTTNGPSSLTGNITNIAGNCIINTYTITGSFGANAAGATVNVCGTNVVANSVGGFIATINYGSACNNITATKSSYNCSTTVNGPASLTNNLSNITGSCIGTNYLTSCTGTGQKKYVIGGVLGTSSAGLTCSDDIIICSGNSAGYILSACNVGATVPLAIGNYFQWGNNGGTPYGNMIPTTILVDASSYGPGNYYNNTTFIQNTIYPRDWSSVRNDNLWGGTGTVIDKQGPCATGYHIPQYSEWVGIISAGGWCGSLCGYNSSDDAAGLSSALKLPKGGIRYLNGTMTNPEYGYYWASNMPTNSPLAFYMDFRGALSGYTAHIGVGAAEKSYSFGIRCFKN